MSTVTAATVEAVLRVRNANFTQEMNNADKTTKKVEQSVKSLETRLSKVGQVASGIGRGLSFGLTSPLLAVGAAAVKTTTDLDALRQGMVKITGSSAEAERQLARLKVIARQPGLGFEEAIKGSLRLQSAGLSAKQAEGALREFGNAIAAVGGGKEQLDGVTVALAQIASKGKVTAEEINQIAERFYGVREAMVKAFGTSDSEILQAAKLSAGEYIDGMVTVLSRDARVGNSLKNQFETAQDDIKESLDRIGKAIAPRVADVFEKIAAAADRMTAAFDRLPKEKQDFLTNLGLGAAIVGPAVAAAGAMAQLAASLSELGVSVGVLKTLAAGGAIALAVTLAFAPHVEAALETKALNDKAAAQDATLPKYSQMRGHIDQLREFQQAKRRYPGNSPVINPLSEMGKALEAAGIGGDATPAQIDAAIARLGREANAAKGELRTQVKATSPREAAARALEAQKKREKAIIDARARAERMKADEEAKKEAKREAERRRKEKEDNDRQFREATAQRVKDAQDRLAGITLSPLALKQREARRQNEEDRYYGVPGADKLLKLTLQSNALDEVRSQFGGFSFGGMLSSGGQDLAKLANKRQKAREALALGLEKLATATEPKNPLPLPSVGSQLDFLRANAPTASAAGNQVVRGGLTRIQQRAALGGLRAARTAGGIAEGAFSDLTEGKDVLGNALARVKSAVFAGIGEEIGRSVERSLRKRLTSVFEDSITGTLGDKLGKAMESSLKGITASAGAILSASYNLIAMLSRPKKFGLGTALGIAAGLAFPVLRPFTLALANAGNAADNGDWQGAVGAAGSAFLTNLGGGGSGGTTYGPRTSFSDVSALAGVTNAGSSGWQSPPVHKSRSRSAVVVVNHYGDINGMEDLEGASQRQGRTIERALSFNG